MGGPAYIPHLRRWVTWKNDFTDWPFVPVTDAEETPSELAKRKFCRDLAMRYGPHWLEIPWPDEDNGKAYAAYQKTAQETYMRDMAVLGYWDIEQDRSGIRPVAKPICFRVDEFPPAPRAVMANVMHKAKLFESVSEARRNGWNKPILPGVYMVGKERQRVEIIGTEPPPRRPNMAIVTVGFETGEEIVFNVHQEPPEDPVDDWSVWCRRWTGDAWESFWRHFTGCRRSVALTETQHEVVYLVRNDPAPPLEGRVEVIMPAINRDGQAANFGKLGLQIEVSRASIERRAPRKFAGLAVRYR